MLAMLDLMLVVLGMAQMLDGALETKAVGVVTLVLMAVEMAAVEVAETAAVEVKLAVA